MHALWSAYRSARSATAGAGAVVELAAVRLLQTAFEHARGLACRRRTSSTLVQLADNMLRRPEDAALACWGCASEPLPRAGRRGARRRDDPRPDPLCLAGPRQPRRSRALDRAELERPGAGATSSRACARSSTRRSTAAAGPCRRAGASPRPHRRTRGWSAAMSQANAGRGSWEPGWTVERLDGDEAVVAGPRCARASRWPTAAADGGRPGAAVSVRLPKELPALSPGFYTAVGDAADTRPRREPRARLLARHAGRRSGARAARSRRDSTAQRVPFRLKVADHPFRLDRCDAAVLYLPRRRVRARRARCCATVAASWRRSCGRRSRRSRSRCAPGVGLAEDDGGERASASAAARCSPRRSCARTSGDAGAGARRRRRGRGASPRTACDIDAPYLEPVARRPPCPLTARSSTPPPRSAGAIVADAVWHDGRCSWMGAVGGPGASVAAGVPARSARSSTTAPRASACSSRSSPR